MNRRKSNGSVISNIQNTSQAYKDPFLVISNGKVVEVLAMIEAGINVNHTRWSGFSLLHRAAQLGYTDICEVLITKGANVKMMSSRGWYTPLHLAMSNGFIETANYLVRQGANPWAKSKYGEDPCDYGAKMGFIEPSTEFRRRISKNEMEASLQRVDDVLSRTLPSHQ